MPFYEYECKACGAQTEVLQKISDKPLRKCPECGKSALIKLVSAPIFRLKGAGWYETDFKSEQDKKRNLAGEDKDSKSDSAADSKSESKTEAKTETKSESKADAKSNAKQGGSSDAKPDKSASKSTSRRSSSAGRAATPARKGASSKARKAK